MTDFREVTTGFSVSPQITVEEIARARAEGFTLVINNRPDGEAPGQPSSAEVEAAARASGMDYLYLPVSGRPTQEQAAAVAGALIGREGKTLAYCRSGTRSIMTWALGQSDSGAMGRDEIVRAAARAGYDLSALLPG